MKIALLFALGMAFLYALENNIVERKISHVSPVAQMFWIHVVALVVLIPIIVIRGYVWPSLMLPSESELVLVILCGILVVSAEYCFLSAYHWGDSEANRLIVVTTALCLIPVIGSVIRGIWAQSWPNPLQLFGCLLAILAVICVNWQSFFSTRHS